MTVVQKRLKIVRLEVKYTVLLNTLKMIHAADSDN